MRKLVVLFSLLALVPFAFAACGGDDDDDATTAAPSATEETTTEAGGEAGGGGATTTLDVAADPGGQLAYEEQSLEAKAGTVTIDFTNESSIPHNVIIESPEGNDVGGTDTITGDETTAEVEIDQPGDYTFYCSVDAHREAGMEGPLTVK